MTYAIFSEYKRDTDLFQGLFIPATTIGAALIAPTFGYRTLMNGRRRQWAMSLNPMYTKPNDPTDAVSIIVSQEITQFESISSYMRSPIVDPGWDLRDAFPVEVTSEDLLALKEHPSKMPDTLNARISQLRDAKGLS